MDAICLDLSALLRCLAAGRTYWTIGDMRYSGAIDSLLEQMNKPPIRHAYFKPTNGSPTTASCIAGDTGSFPRDIGLEPKTTTIGSQQRNGNAEPFVRTIKFSILWVGYGQNDQTVLRRLPPWITPCNEAHPHKAPVIFHPAASSQLVHISKRSFGEDNKLFKSTLRKAY